MSCAWLTPEDYQLYALGLCEPPEAERIRTHLADGCDNCNAELKRSVVFWYRFALVGAEDSQAEPRPELRRRVLKSVQGTQVDRRPPIVWSWPMAAAAALVVGLASTFSWYLGDQQSPRKSQPGSVAATQ